MRYTVYKENERKNREYPWRLCADLSLQVLPVETHKGQNLPFNELSMVIHATIDIQGWVSISLTSQFPY